MSWWMWLTLLLLAGSLLGGGGELALDVFRGTVDPVTGAVDFIGSWAAGFYNWDRIGVNALADLSGAMAKLTIVAVVVVYILMFRLFFRATWIVRDFVRRKGIVSKTRAKLMCIIFAIILMAIFTWGFEFPRALLGALL